MNSFKIEDIYYGKFDLGWFINTQGGQPYSGNDFPLEYIENSFNSIGNWGINFNLIVKYNDLYYKSYYSYMFSTNEDYYMLTSDFFQVTPIITKNIIYE